MMKTPGVIILLAVVLTSCQLKPEPVKEEPWTDTEPPVLVVDELFDGRQTGLTVTLSGSASDNVAVEGVYLSVNSGDFIRLDDPTNWQTNIALAEGPHTLSFYAKDTSGLISPFQTFTVSATSSPDTAAPDVTILTPDGIESVGFSFTASGTASDNTALEGVYVSLDGGAYQKMMDKTNWSRGYTVAGTGIHSLHAYARDMAGNRSETNSRYFDVNPSVPTVSITNPTNHTYTGLTNITLSGTAWDDTALEGVYAELSPNGFGRVSGTASWSTNMALPSASGWYTIRAYAKDTAGNYSSSAFINICLDLIPPTNQVTSPTNGQMVLLSTFPLYGKIQDNTIPVAGLRAAVTLSSGESFFVTADLAGNWLTNLTLTNGTYTAWIHALDLAGNRSATNELNFTVKADVEIPTAEITNFGHGDALDTPFDAVGIAADDTAVAAVYLIVDIAQTNTAVGTADWRVNNLNLSNGFHTLGVYAVDVYNRVGITRNYTVYADSTPPNMLYTSSNTGGADYRIEIRFTDPGGLTNWMIARPGGSWETNVLEGRPEEFVYSEETNCSDGVYLYRTAARDFFGHVTGVQSNTLVVDGLPPTNWITNPTAVLLASGSFGLTGYSRDNVGVAGVYAGVTNDITNYWTLIWHTNAYATNAAWSWPCGLPEGSNTLSVVSVDWNMNTSPTNRLDLVVDLTPPELTGVLPAHGASIPTNVTVSGTAWDLNGLAGVYLSVDSGPYRNLGPDTNWSTNIILDEGLHTLRVYAMDAAGRCSLTNTAAVTVVTN